jgi:hypothetical protein
LSRPPRHRLTRVAEPLAPERPPFHIQAADRSHRAPGWYYRPSGVAHDVYLGYNHIVAEIALLEALDRQETAA